MRRLRACHGEQEGTLFMCSLPCLIMGKGWLKKIKNAAFRQPSLRVKNKLEIFLFVKACIFTCVVCFWKVQHITLSMSVLQTRVFVYESFAPIECTLIDRLQTWGVMGRLEVMAFLPLLPSENPEVLWKHVKCESTTPKTMGVNGIFNSDKGVF